MDALIFSFEIIFPFLLYMLAGMACRKLEVIGPEGPSKINRLVFRLFLPVSLFFSTATASPSLDQALLTILYALACLLATFFLAWAFYAKKPIRPGQKGVMVQDAYRSNLALFGVALTEALLQGKGTGITEAVIGVLIPAFNLISVFILSYYGEEAVKRKELFWKIIKNPLIDAIALGTLFRVLGIPIGGPLKTGLTSLAHVATPLALVGLGAGFSFQQTKAFRKLLYPAVFTRLLLAPGIFLSLAAALGFQGEPMVSLLAFLAGPCSVSSYAMADAMGKEGPLAGQILLYTTALCSFTLFLFISLLKAGGLI